MCVRAINKRGGGIEQEIKMDDIQVKGRGLLGIKMDDIKVKGEGECLKLKWMTLLIQERT